MTASSTRTAPKAIPGPRVLVPAVIALALLAARPGAAQPPSAELCLPHAEMTQLLGARYAEAPTAIGVTSAGGLMELFRTESGSTWSLILTTPQGRSCLMSSGSSWSPRRTLVAGAPA